MRNSQDNEKPKQTVRKGNLPRATGTKAENSQRKPKPQAIERPTVPDEAASSSSRLVLTQEELRSRIARQAFELYEKRRAVTEVDDWVEAERLVKMHLLSEGQSAGSV